MSGLWEIERQLLRMKAELEEYQRNMQRQWAMREAELARELAKIRKMANE